MKKALFAICLIILFFLPNLAFSEPPVDAQAGLMAYRITKLGFYSGNMSDIGLQKIENVELTDSDFDFIKELSENTWIYLNYLETNIPSGTTFETITGIVPGEYIVFCYYEEAWFAPSSEWQQLTGWNNTWGGFFTYNGSYTGIGFSTASFSNIDLDNYQKVTVEGNKNTSLAQTITDVNNTGLSTNYTSSVEIGTPQ